MQTQENKPVLMKCEVLTCGPYRFIGKSVYARTGISGKIFGCLWENSDWIFEIIDGLQEYAVEDTHNAALCTFNKYDKKTELIGYTFGRFMRADTPVPNGMDFFDIPECRIAKGFLRGKFDGRFDVDADFDNASAMIKKEITQQGIILKPSAKIFAAEIYPTLPDSDGFSVFGKYIAYELNKPGTEIKSNRT